MTAGTDRNDPDAAVTNRGIDIAAGVILAALAMLALVWLIPTHTQPADSQFDVAPGFFPSLAVGAVMILSLMMVAHRLWRRGPSRSSGLPVVLELIVWTATAVAVMLLLHHAGFLPMAALLLAAAMYFSGNRNVWLIAAMAIVFPLAVDWGAWLIFTVDLP